ncbi:PREDICTED: uncharacterized protein LOC107064592 isoform X2 [Polistes dominula]|nr:PREDICTED: uncharacterized protein LOC107064592 isoform X2 [Polistes dominula]
MEKYTQQGKKFTFVCLMLSCATIIILLVWTSFLFIYDIVVPLNGTHRLQSPFVAEYFIDEDIYFYPILLHMYTIFLVGLMVVIATETFYTICMQHACGLFQIVGYRFERIFNQSTSSSITLQEMNLKFDDWVSRAIQSHQTAIAFVDHMNSCFTMSYFWLLILAVLSLTMNCTDILQAVNPNKNYNLVNSSVRIINAFVRIVNIVCYLFGVFYCGQRIIDHSTGISEKVYAIPWFLESSKIQTTIIIVLQRSFKESVLLAGGLYPMSFELLEVILRTTSCYITTLHALQN